MLEAFTRAIPIKAAVTRLDKVAIVPAGLGVAVWIYTRRWTLVAPI